MCNFNAFTLDQENLSSSPAMSKEKSLGFLGLKLGVQQRIGLN